MLLWMDLSEPLCLGLPDRDARFGLIGFLDDYDKVTKRAPGRSGQGAPARNSSWRARRGWW
jgi:hypothetical protein